MTYKQIQVFFCLYSMSLLQKFGNIAKINLLDMISETDKQYLISLEKEYNENFVRYSQVLDKAKAFQKEINDITIGNNALVYSKGKKLHISGYYLKRCINLDNIEYDIVSLNKYYLSAINATIEQYAEIEINDIICSKKVADVIQPLFFNDLYEYVISILNGKTFAQYTKDKAILAYLKETFNYKDLNVAKNALSIKSINVDTRYSINQHFGYKGKETFFAILAILSFFENGKLEDISGLVFNDTEFEANKLYPISFQHASELKIDKRGKITIYFTDYEKALNFYNFIYANLRK